MWAISSSSTSTIPPFSPRTLRRNASGTAATRSTIGFPTPASSISGSVFFIGASFRDRQAGRQEGLVVDLDQDGIFAGLREDQVADLVDQVYPRQRSL